MINQYIEQVDKFSRIDPVVSVEIGALDGEYTRLLRARFGLLDENTYLVEPNPDLHPVLQAAFPAAHHVPCAISASGGSCTLNRVISKEKDRIGSSSLRNRVDRWTEYLTYDPVEVQTLTGAELRSRINRQIDLCIIDVEGCAHEVLASFGAELSHVRSIMIECEHRPLFEGQRLYDEVRDYLVGFGFMQMAFQYSYAYQSDSVWIQEELVDFMKGWP